MHIMYVLLQQVVVITHTHNACVISSLSNKLTCKINLTNAIIYIERTQ